MILDTLASTIIPDSLAATLLDEPASTAVLSCLAVLAALLSLILLVGSYRKQPDGHTSSLPPPPPGPRGWPVIGYLPHLGRRPHEVMTSLAGRYGDVTRIQMGCWDTVVISGMDTIRQALVKQADDFAGRPAFYTFKYMADGKSMGFGDFGPRWRLHRRIAQNALAMFVNNRESPIDVIIQDEAEVLVGNLLNNQPEPGIDPHDEIFLSVGSIICNVCFGKKYKRDDEDFVKLVKMNAEFMAYAGAGNPVDVLPWMRHFTKRSFNGFLKILHTMEAFCDKKREEHKKTYDAGRMRDVTDALQRAVDEIPSQDKDDVGLTNDHILNTVQEMIGAGFDTIATTLHWAVLYMTTNPEVQTKIQTEIDDITACNRPISIDDMGHMTYTQACIQEIMRLSCIFPLALPHSTTKDTTLNGYLIAEKSLVFINLWSVTRDANKFPNPEEFSPERFLEDGKLNKLAQENFLPYSAGRRRCPGEKLARLEVFIFFATLFQRCRFEQVSGEPYSYQSMYGLTLKPQPFKVKVMERNWMTK